MRKKHLLLASALLLTYASPCMANNTAYGTAAGADITTGTEDTLIGIQAGQSITTGASNTAVGYQAGKNVTSGTLETSVGQGAMQGISATPLTGSYNTALGVTSMMDLQGAATQNTTVGVNAGAYISTGSYNTAVGVGAMNGGAGSPITGSDNTGVGVYSLDVIQGAADDNTALGWGSGDAVTTGTDNTTVGFESGNSITTGTFNVIVGEAGNISTGNSNILIGNSLSQTTAGTSSQIDIGDTILVPGDTHLALHSTSPTQDGTSCGNSGFAIAGNDNAMQITQGSTTSTTCKINFASTWANNAPICTANFAGTTSVGAYITASASTTILTLTFSATEASQKINVACIGYK